jgi:(p)ppGpp synthase/HD superfamily hydrolase
MDDLAFRRLMGNINLHEPQKAQLWRVLERELATLNPTKKEVRRVKTSFAISFWGHQKAPVRASGEAYIFHVVRATIRSIWRQRELGIRDIELIIIILLHDSFEDAKKAGISPLLMHSRVHFQMGHETGVDVLYLTKQKQRNETNDEAFTRLIRSERWRPVIGKLEDRTDNILTIASMPLPNQIAKLKETEIWLPLLTQQGEALVAKEIESGRLSPNFRYLLPSICNELVPALRAQKLRLKLP